MIFIHFSANGARKTADLENSFSGQAAMLIGGAPSLREQPLELLNKRGVLTMAMNNAARHFQPSLWVSGDRPECYEPQILLDPRIMKFAPFVHHRVMISGRSYAQMPNTYFYLQEENVPWDEYFALRQSVPWYHNTLFVGIHILYRLGVRHIILGGSEFGFGIDGRMYAHETELGKLERKWNLDLYNSQVRELRMMKPVFEKAGLTFMDCSKRSRLCQTYQHISLEQAVELCLKRFPKAMVDPKELPHCSKFAPESIQKRIAKWPGHQVLGAGPGPGAQDEMKTIL